MLYVHDDDDIMEQTEKGVELAMCLRTRRWGGLEEQM